MALALPAFAANGSERTMQTIRDFSIDRTEVTVGQFREFVNVTGLRIKAETDGGGLVYAVGWQQKADWTWRTPYGVSARNDEPAVHVSFDECPLSGLMICFFVVRARIIDLPVSSSETQKMSILFQCADVLT